jgi:DeoR/GlpR family transcriptional regulator of sugar metabolism
VNTSIAAGQLRYLDAPERRRRILVSLREAGFQSVTALADALQVSDMTIRRDLRRLEATGAVRIVHGGASLPHGTLQTPSFVSRADAQSAAKRRIAMAARTFIEDAETVGIDAGTTTYELAVALGDGFSGTVITHSVPVIQHFLHHPEVRLIALGGELNHDSQAFVGPLTVDAMTRLRLRRFVLGAFAVDEDGVFVNQDLERPTKLELMNRADEVVLVADASKFEHSAPVLLCPLKRLTRVVTDQPLTGAIARRLAAANVDVVVARE